MPVSIQTSMHKKIIPSLLLISIGWALASCQKRHVNTIPVSQIELGRYMGSWYEIARYPNSFEAGLDQVKAHYCLREDSGLNIHNEGRRADGKSESIHGRGIQADPDIPARLRVSFVPPYIYFFGQYNILFVNEDYSLALVSGKGDKYLWILARQPQISEADKDMLLKQAHARGFNTSKLYWTRQD